MVESNKEWTVSLPIHGTEVEFKIDTGADISLISENTLSSLKHQPQLKFAQVNLESPVGKLHCKGQFTATTAIKNRQF